MFLRDSNVKIGPTTNTQFFYDSPIHSDVEAKLRQMLIKLAGDNKILGIQVCAYKDGKVVIDTAAGVLGEDDPRPVQHDSLFPVFSVTKGIAAGMLHWLVDSGKLKLDENVAHIWSGFGINKKDSIKVHHVLNHTSGLHNALPDTLLNLSSMSNWEECLHGIVTSIPESEPGQEQLYHHSSFGWLCGGIIEHASGKKFQEVLNEAIVRPLNMDGELYVGIPPGMESRLASLTPDIEEFESILSGNFHGPDMPSSFQPAVIVRNCPIYAKLYSSYEARRAIAPSVNGNLSARALARYYATLASGGIVPPLHSPSNEVAAMKDTSVTEDSNHNCGTNDGVNRIFHNPKILDAFMGVGDYGDLALPSGSFGLGFQRYNSAEGLTGFGHAGLGGSNGLCDVKHQFAIAVTVNKMTLGAVTAHIVKLVCSELNVPVPQEVEILCEMELHLKVN